MLPDSILAIVKLAIKMGKRKAGFIPLGYVPKDSGYIAVPVSGFWGVSTLLSNKATQIYTITECVCFFSSVSLFVVCGLLFITAFVVVMSWGLIVILIFISWWLITLNKSFTYLQTIHISLLKCLFLAHLPIFKSTYLVYFFSLLYMLDFKYLTDEELVNVTSSVCLVVW